MKFSVRAATPRVGELLRLYRHAWWTRTRRARDLRRMLRHSDLAFCARAKGSLAGFARVSTDFSYRAVVWDVIVDPAFHGKGLGTALVKAVLRHPRLRRVESFWLFTTDKQRFYRRFGFRHFPKNVMVLRKKAPPP